MKTKWLPLMLTLALLAACALPFPQRASAADPMQVALSLIDHKPNKPLKKGGKFELAVTAKDAEDIFGIEFVLEYDPKMAELRDDPEVSKAYNGWVRKVDKRSGRVTLAMTRKTLPPGSPGDIRLATIEFKALKPGEASFKLKRIQAVDAAPAALPANAEFPLVLTIADKGKPDRPND